MSQIFIFVGIITLIGILYRRQLGCFPSALLLLLALPLFLVVPYVATPMLLLTYVPLVVAAFLAYAIEPAEILGNFKTLGPIFDRRLHLWSRIAIAVFGLVITAFFMLRGAGHRILEDPEFGSSIPKLLVASVTLLMMGFVFLIVLSVPIALIRTAFRPTLRNLKTTHGSARFFNVDASFGKHKKAVAALLVLRPDCKKAEEGFVRPIGKASARVAYLSWEDLTRHVLVIGNSGAGKTTGVFTHLMLSAQGIPWIYQDQKADLPLRDQFPDRPVWGLDTPGYETRSGVWNPIDEIKNPAEDAEVMGALLFPDRLGENDWVYKGARNIFIAVLTKLRGESRLDSFQTLARSLVHGNVEEFIQALPPGLAANLDDPRTRSTYMDTLQQALKPWLGPRISRITSGRSTVTLDDFIERGGYVLANESLKPLRSATTFFWGMLLQRLRNRPAGSSRLMLLLDEFGDAGRIPEMVSALATFRSKDVSIVAGIQTYSLMQTVYQNEWGGVRDGFGTRLVLTRNLPPEMYELLTGQLGTATESQLSPGVTKSAAGVSATALVPVDQWPRWGGENVCIPMMVSYVTWWVPVSVRLDPAPVGAPASAFSATPHLPGSDQLFSCTHCGAPLDSQAATCAGCNSQTPKVF